MVVHGGVIIMLAALVKVVHGDYSCQRSMCF